MTIAQKRYQAARNVTLWGAFVNALLGILKVVFGILGHSHALFADGIHSFSDLVTDGVVIFAHRYGSQEADSEHPYGHGRIETAVTVALALLLILVGIGIVYDAVMHLWLKKVVVEPSFYVMVIAAFSILANESLFHWTLFVGRKIDSSLLQANAWHHRSDAFSSIVVLIGILGTYFGYSYFDSVAALIVGILIVKMGWQLGWSNIQELIDTGLDEETLQEIRRTIQLVPGVKALHHLRSRSHGGKAILDVHILVNPRLSVSEGHHIGEAVGFTLIKKISVVEDVTVHVDPEDDEIIKPSRNLPHREELIEKLTQSWQAYPEAQQIKNIDLHYLAGKIHIEVYLPLTILQQYAADSIKQHLSAAVSSLAFVATLDIFYG